MKQLATYLTIFCCNTKGDRLERRILLSLSGGTVFAFTLSKLSQQMDLKWSSSKGFHAKTQRERKEKLTMNAQHAKLNKWVNETAAWCRPDAVVKIRVHRLRTLRVIMHARDLAGQVGACVTFWISGLAWVRIYPDARHIAACLFGMVEGGTFYWQGCNHCGHDAGLLSGDYPGGPAQTALRRATASHLA